MNENLSKIVEDVKAGRVTGATILRDGSSAEFRTGYLVSVMCVDLLKATLNLDTVNSVITGLCHRAVIEGANVDCFGLFDYGDGFVSVDANLHIENQGLATALAREFHQAAFWDCAKSEAITVPKA